MSKYPICPTCGHKIKPRVKAVSSTQEYRNGRNAALASRPSTDNPYRPDHPKFKMWSKGWKSVRIK